MHFTFIPPLKVAPGHYSPINLANGTKRSDSIRSIPMLFSGSSRAADQSNLPYRVLMAVYEIMASPGSMLPIVQGSPSCLQRFRTTWKGGYGPTFIPLLGCDEYSV